MQKRETSGFVRAALGLLIFAVCFGAVIYSYSRSRRAQAERDAAAAAVEAAAEAAKQQQLPPPAPVKKQAAAPVSETAIAPVTTSVPAPVARTAVKVEPLTPGKMREGLVSFESLTNALSYEQIEMVSQTFKQIAAGGTASIPIIAEYLEKLTDVSLNSNGLLNFPTLRTGLIDALNQIGGPQSTELMAKALQGTADPFEIGLLGKYLEGQSPGQYSKDVIDAARESLKMAEKGELGTRDVAPIFQALRGLNTPEAKAELESDLSKWNYYATMGLANLPDGAGVAPLIARLNDPNAADSSDNRFALQMLAQLSTTSQEAQQALLQLAQSGKISAAAWPKVITALTGDQYRFGDPRLGEPSILGASGLKTYHIQFGNQNFYSLPLASLNPGDIPARQALIDTMLKYDLPPETKDQLKQARNSFASIASIK